MMTGADIVRVAREWIGTRWRHQAAQRGVGTDCVGLLVGVAYELGLGDARAESRDVDFNGYGRAPDPSLLLRAANHYLEPAAGPEVGGVLLMRFASNPQHFAIISQVSPLPYIIHAYAQARKVVENRVDTVWRQRIVRYYRFPGVTDG